uniref:Protein XRP2 n=2 Tax=Clastoptera arizonana TaxID=38151 RepID=A0A1B6DQU9_9HEMI
MGFIFSKCTKKIERNGENSLLKKYSWDDKKSVVDPSDYILNELLNKEAWKLPGDINGEQIVIKNCTNTLIYVLDHINMVTIDDCIGCKIITGPVKGSVFIRDCKECVLVIACSQFRIRDCKMLDVFLSCATQPILESSSNIRFGCYHLSYLGLEDHFSTAFLSPFNNSWYDIHDFTPTQGGHNWSILPNKTSILDYLQPPAAHGNLRISLNKNDSIVPVTTGIFNQLTDVSEACLVVFFFDGREENTASTFIRKFNHDMPDAKLLTTKKVLLSPRDAEIIFGTTTYNQVTTRGPLIGLVVVGQQVNSYCQKAVSEITSETDKIYVSNDQRTSTVQVDTFINVSNMNLQT